MGKKQTPTKSKLFKLREWMTVPDAARYLSIIWGEEVSEADVLMLAIDGHLTLSINFVNCTVALQIMSTLSELEADIRASDNRPVLDLYNNKIFKFKDKADMIEGVWDLLLLGKGPDIIKKRYHKLTSGPIVRTYESGIYLIGKSQQIVALQESRPMTSIDLNENMVEKVAKGEFHYKDPANFRLSDKLPVDSMLVVRTDALINLQDHFPQKTFPNGKPLDTRAERTYLNIIGAFLEVVTGTFNDRKFSSETQLREFIAEKFDGFRGVSSRTLAEKFALAKKAINGELD